MSDEPPLLPMHMAPSHRRYRIKPRHLIYFGQIWGLASLWCVYLLGYYYLPATPWFMWFFSWETTAIFVTLSAGTVLLRLYRRISHVRIWRMERQKVRAQLEAGEFEAAGAELERICEAAAGEADYHAQFTYLRAIAFMRAGKPDAALPLFMAVLQSGWFRRRGLRALYPQLLGNIASAYALRGTQESAEYWEGLAHDATPLDRSAELLPMHALIGIRRGRFEAVLIDAEREWAAAEQVFALPEMNALRVLCAYAAGMAPAKSGRNAAMDAHLRAIATFRPGDFDYLAVNWPQFQAFLAQHGFSSAVHREAAVLAPLRPASPVTPSAVSSGTPPDHNQSLP